jgi:fatty-acyl-CoA synthase
MSAAAGGLAGRWQPLVQGDPGRPALVAGGMVFTRGDLETMIAGETQSLSASGIGPRDIVAWLGINTPTMLATLLACERLGAVFLPLNWRLAIDELVAIVRHAGVRTVRGTADLRSQYAHLRQAIIDDGGVVCGAAQAGDLMLVYTSGTTGAPKGAMHTAAAMRANAEAAIAVQALNETTRTLSVLPMFHVGGLCIQTLPTLLAGGTVCLHPRFDAGQWLADVASWRPDTSLLVPATMRAILDHPGWPTADLSSLRFINSGSSVVPAGLIAAFHARGVPVAQVYGSTETGPFSIALRPDEAMGHVGQVGRVAPGVKIRLADADGAAVPLGEVGEILVRGDNLMRGYHRASVPESFRDGWFHSGDLARRGPDGFYEVVGRSKDMIISGGENIYPAEIENLVVTLPGVAECAVIGVPDARWGEVPVLVLVAQARATLDPAAVRAAYEPRLARFKHPRRVLVMDALPKTALGKVQKGALAAAIQQAV